MPLNLCPHFVHPKAGLRPAPQAARPVTERPSALGGLGWTTAEPPRRRAAGRLAAMLAFSAALVPASTIAGTASYPQRPVTLVVPTSPGGGTDAVARVVADALSRALGQPFMVQNQPGANGLLGNAWVARARPDGYRLLFTYASTLVVNPLLYRHPGYDPLRDFEPVAQIGRGGTLLLVSTRLPVHTVADFVRYARRRPKQLSYCSWGQGSGGHLAMASLLHDTHLDLVHVPYKSSPACINDLLGGQVEAAFADAWLALPLVREGRLRALALSAEERLAALPQVPTLNETGYPFQAYSWLGLFAPAGTPASIVDQLNTALNQAFQQPETRQRLAAMQLTDLPVITPAQFKATLEKDMAEWARVVHKLGLQPE